MSEECFCNFPFNSWRKKFCFKCNRASECASGAVLEKQGDILLEREYGREIAELYVTEPNALNRMAIKHEWARDVIRRQSINLN